MKRKWILIAAITAVVAMVFSLSLAGCTTTATETTVAETTVAETTAAETTAAETTAAAELPVVGISTGSSGTTWRTTMIKDLEAVGDEYKAAGKIADYKIVNNVTNGDATEQANIIRDFISQGANIILINPNSLDALNGVLQEAQEAGILCVVFDANVSATGILNVTVDHYNWIKPLAKAFCELLGGKGDVVNVSGLEGHPANTNFDNGFLDTVKEFPDIKVVSTYYSGWNETGAKEGAVQVLGSGINVDGWFQAGSMGIGVLSACIEAGRIPKAMTANPDAGFYKLWNQMHEEGKDFKAVGQPNPPGISATAFRIALNVYNGMEWKADTLANTPDNPTFYMPVNLLLTEENFDEYWAQLKDQPDDFLIDYLNTQEEIDELFQ